MIGALVVLTPLLSAVALLEVTLVIALGRTVKLSDEHPETFGVSEVSVTLQRKRLAALFTVIVLVVLRPPSAARKLMELVAKGEIVAGHDGAGELVSSNSSTLTLFAR